jgi:hypothetical protein
LRVARAKRPSGVEGSRALSLFHAVNLTGDRFAAQTLLGAAGRANGEPVVSASECEALAEALRSKGYPLTDAGIKRFKMERGFSEAVRLGPDVASAYARFVAGREARLDVNSSDFRKLDLEIQRAFSLLSLIGESTEELSAVARALGTPLVRKDGAVRPPITVELAMRMATFGRDHRMPLTDAGLAEAAAALGWASAIVDKKLARFVAGAVLARGEPVHDYSRLTCQSCTLNGRTLAMLTAAESSLKGEVAVRVIKGSYQAESSTKGAHPHMGGGAADLSVRGVDGLLIDKFVLALRRAGFAAWFRNREDKPHVHAVAIGDREMAPAAQWQVKQYFLGKDGRSRMDKDPHGGLPSDLPGWVAKYRLLALTA